MVDQVPFLELDRHQDVRYELTEAGQAFRPVIEALGQWGIRRVDSLTDADVDPALLMWDVHRRVDSP